MFFFPLLNLLFLIILYRVHKNIFIITTILEVLLNGIGIYYVYTVFARTDIQTLYMLALTGLGSIVALIAFFIAIILNQKHLYSDHE